MDIRKKISVLLAVSVIAGLFAADVTARRYDTSMIGYDRWITEDYRYESWNTPRNFVIESDIFPDAKKEVDISEDGSLDPVGAVFGVFNWIGDTVGSVLGAQVDDPYQANP